MNLNITMLTTGYPRFEGDLFGFFVADLARALVAAGHGVEVVAPGHKGVTGREETDGIRVRRVGYAWPSGLMKLAYGGGLVPNLRAKPYLAALLPQFLTTWGLAAARRAATADIFHGQWVVSGWLGLATRFIHNRPVVVTLRGSDLALLRGLPPRAARRLVKGFDQITTVSREIREAVLGLGLPDEQVRIIPNGVDTTLFRPQEKASCRGNLGLDPEAVIMLYAVGRLSPEKGVLDLIRAVPILTEECPKAKVVLLGDGPLEKELKAEAGSLGLGDRVEIRPAVDRRDLAAWYNAADLICLASHREGRPNTILEAMACGRPILATRVGGVPELIEDGQNGLLVPARDPKAFGQAAAQLLNDPAMAGALGAKGPAGLDRLGLTWEKSAALTEEAYWAALETRIALAEKEPLFRGGAASLWLLAGWAALVGGIFLARYGKILDQGYGITSRLGREGLGALLGRFLGL